VLMTEGETGPLERIFFGNDRIPLLEMAIRRAQGRPYRFHDTSGVPQAEPHTR